MRYWAGLYQESSQEVIKEGVGLMVQTAIKLLKSQDDGKNMKTLKDGGSSELGDEETPVNGDVHV
jgi:hypothetical protein